SSQTVDASPSREERRFPSDATTSGSRFRFSSAALDGGATGAIDKRPSPYELGLEARIRTAYGYRDRQSQLSDINLEPTIELQLPKQWRLAARGRFRADARDAIEPDRPDQSPRSSANRRILIGDRAEIELREAYIQGELATVNWTIGKQAIVWGESDGFKVLDVVNPQSFREFVLPDFEDSRIPLWSARAERAFGDTVLEGVVVFDNTYDDLPPPGAIFELTSPRFIPQEDAIRGALTEAAASGSFAVPPDFNPAIRILTPQRDGAADALDFGGRIKTFVDGWDLSLLYFRHTDDSPDADIRFAQNGDVIVTPVYDRVNLIGASFANTLGDFTFRGELGYTTDREFALDVDATSLSLTDPINQLVERDVVSYVLGVDWYGLADTVISFQFFQDSVLNAPDGLLRPSDDFTLTGFVRRTSLQEKLIVELEWLTNLEDDDALLRPLVQFDQNDNVAYYISGDIFIGPSTGVFGQFEPASRVSLGALFSF
ncbi:MAG: DUF1302 family protein, partial [Pseudomonadota bacterium]